MMSSDKGGETELAVHVENGSASAVQETELLIPSGGVADSENATPNGSSGPSAGGTKKRAPRSKSLKGSSELSAGGKTRRGRPGRERPLLF